MWCDDVALYEINLISILLFFFLFSLFLLNIQHQYSSPTTSPPSKVYRVYNHTSYCIQSHLALPPQQPHLQSSSLTPPQLNLHHGRSSIMRKHLPLILFTSRPLTPILTDQSSLPNHRLRANGHRERHRRYPDRNH